VRTEPGRLSRVQACVQGHISCAWPPSLLLAQCAIAATERDYLALRAAAGHDAAEGAALGDCVQASRHCEPGERHLDALFFALLPVITCGWYTQWGQLHRPQRDSRTAPRTPPMTQAHYLRIRAGVRVHSGDEGPCDACNDTHVRRYARAGRLGHEEVAKQAGGARAQAAAPATVIAEADWLTQIGGLGVTLMTVSLGKVGSQRLLAR